MWQKAFVIAYAGFLGVAFAIGAGQWFGGVGPALPALGLMLTAISPLLFLAWTRAMSVRHKQHPVLVSAAMGLGCVCIMIGIQRFGDQHQWLLILALIALVGWMGYQRWIWRAASQQSRP